MPKYEYTCLNCDYSMEITRSIYDDAALPVCEKCAWPMKKVYSAPAVQFKGSGFYSTGN